MSTRLSNVAPGQSEPIQRNELEPYFLKASRPRPDWMVGVEHEKIGVTRHNGQPLPFDGPGGIEAMLIALSDRFHWEKFTEAGRVIALARAGATVTLEPGGQVELSSAPNKTLEPIRLELLNHLNELHAVTDATHVAWLSIGVTPFALPDEISIMPKQRYRVMDDYLPRASSTARHMMRATASVQASFDFESEEDAVKKFVAAISVTPLVNVIFGNSPIFHGEFQPNISYRGYIWQHMDPTRSGVLSEVVRIHDFSFSKWVEYLLDVPMMFYCINDVFEPAFGRTFRNYMQHGHKGHFPTLEDWEMHLTSVFPEVRLKKFLEVRGADCVPWPLVMSLPAIWKGLLYDEMTLDSVNQLASAWTENDRVPLFETAFKEGLSGQFKGKPIFEWSQEILKLAREGLQRRNQLMGEADETVFLEPADAIVKTRESPGAQLRHLLTRVTPADLLPLVEYAPG